VCEHSACGLALTVTATYVWCEHNGCVFALTEHITCVLYRFSSLIIDVIFREMLSVVNTSLDSHPKFF
jgi:hypothetical protein